MEGINFLDLFQGIQTLVQSEPTILIARIGLMFLGMLLVYLGKKGTLEPLLMIPMGLGMTAINAGVLFMPGGAPGTLFLDPMVSNNNALMNILQIDFLQPIYTFAFSNGLIACFVFMGIGVLLDVEFFLARPFTSMFLALCAELGTFMTIPIATSMGMSVRDAASIAMVGGADGPMVLFTSLMLSKDLFVPITVVAYLYLGLTYGGYPYLIKLLIPKKLRGLQMPPNPNRINITKGEKLAFAVIANAVLCLLFPVAAPLFFSLFIGVAIRESGIQPLINLLSGTVLYGATFLLGLLLGVLCEANVIFNPKILKLLILGIVSLLLAGIGGIIGGYIMYFITGGKFNPTIGIAGVSCVPTTAKVAQKEAQKANPNAMILSEAIGANICGVITTAIITGIFVTYFSKM